MTTLTASTPAQATVGSNYAANVSRAARALVHALFAVKPRVATSASRVTARDLYRLYGMANKCESVMPNLAQELRFIAARGN